MKGDVSFRATFDEDRLSCNNKFEQGDSEFGQAPNSQEVSTLKEQGYDVEVESYAGLAAHAGTSDEVVRTLEGAVAKALASEDVRKSLKDLGMEPVYMTSAEYKTLLRKGHAAMGEDLPIVIDKGN